VAPTCPTGGLALTAPSGAAVSGFDETKLSASANTDFTICFDNQDPGTQHNVAVLTAENGSVIMAGNIIIGAASELVDVPGQAAGTYFYQCQVHPTTMTGTLTIK
jgi:plastocyanin